MTYESSSLTRLKYSKANSQIYQWDSSKHSTKHTTALPCNCYADLSVIWGSQACYKSLQVDFHITSGDTTVNVVSLYWREEQFPHTFMGCSHIDATLPRHLTESLTYFHIFHKWKKLNSLATYLDDRQVTLKVSGKVKIIVLTRTKALKICWSTLCSDKGEKWSRLHHRNIIKEYFHVGDDIIPNCLLLTLFFFPHVTIPHTALPSPLPFLVSVWMPLSIWLHVRLTAALLAPFATVLFSEENARMFYLQCQREPNTITTSSLVSLLLKCDC